jgi:adenine-specific DNA-methyltransferase
MKLEHLKLESESGAKINLDALYQICPSCFTECKIMLTGGGKTLHHVVDFNKLRQLLGDDAVEDAPEAYEFNWVGKQEARREVAKPINKTLRPVKEDSVDWDTTQNLYIEGDNLEALKLLQKSYLGKVKMIYIDPPYNTGNDFVYDDDFAATKQEDDLAAGNVDELGNRFRKNSDTNGRFHSDWCSMIYPRLMLARTLLTEDGVIFISIDDNEVRNLRNICDEVFGESNFVATFPWRKRTAKSDVPYGVSQDYEWSICYAKSNLFVAGVAGKERKYYETEDFPNKPWRTHDLTKQTTASERPNSFFTIINPKNGEQFPANQNATWRITKETFPQYLTDNRIIFPGDYDFMRISKPVLRYWKEDDIKKAGEGFGRVAVSTKFPDEIGMSQDGTKEVISIFDGKIFSFPKPSSLISFFISIINDSDAIILDFFSGSATTAHSVMQLNSEDQGNRKFIMVQLPEETSDDSEAYKAGYKNICEIGKERIRRAGKKIKEELDAKNQQGGLFAGQEEKTKLDTGFRVFRIADSNMKDVYFSPKAFKQEDLGLLLDNVKPDRTDLDLLFGCMLDWGVQLSMPMAQETIDGCTIYTVNEGDLVACFNEQISQNVIKAIADKAPLKIIFRDNCFGQDDAKINIYESFKQLMDWSDDEVFKNIKVI